MTQQPESSLSQGLKWSILGHIGFFLLVTVKSFLFTEHLKPYIPTLKVDLVALPDVLKKDQIASSPSQAHIPALEQKKTPQKAETQTAPSHDMSLASKTHKLSPAEKNKEILKRFRSLTKVHSWDEESRPRVPAHLIKGNQISKGSSLDGEARESASIDYRDLLKDRLSPNFQLPVWLKRQTLNAQVRIFIADSGRVIRYVFENRSNNSQFDTLVVRAIEQSEPLPSPPQELRQKMMNHGILVGFPLL